jgi:two-component system, NtrC family, sensor kinase
MPAEKILIVEDEQLLVPFMKSSLEQIGYKITATASTGEGAIEAAKKHNPDIVLMDIELQGQMDGIEAARRIRSEFGIPAIFVTGDQREDTMTRAHSAEPLGFIPKPFTVKALRGAIEAGLYSYQAMQSRTRKAILKAENSYRDLFENMIQGVFQINSSGEFVLVNPAFARTLGYGSPDEFLESKPNILRHFVDPERHRVYLEALAEKGYITDFEYEAFRKDGGHVWLAQNTRSLFSADRAEPYFEGIVQDISERKHAETKLKKSTEYLNRLLNCIGDPIFVKDRQHRFLFSNDASCAFVGLSREEMIGKTGVEFTDGDTVDLILTQEERVFRTGMSDITTEELRLRDGQSYTVMVHKTLLADADGSQQIVGVIRNITNLKRIEDDLRESEARLLSVINSAQDGIVMMDGEGIVTLFSPAAERITGYATADIIGKNLHSLLAPSSLHVSCMSGFSEWKATGKGKAIGKTLEMPCLRKDKTEINVELSLSSVKIKGFWMAVGIIRDITERKQIEAERDRIKAQLFQAQKLEAIGQLAAGIAHEINTPTQYVGDNTRFLMDAFADLNEILQIYDRLLKENREGRVNSELLDEIEKTIVAKDLNYIAEETPKAISQSLEGLNRIATIVRAMKEFSYPGGPEKQPVDLNRAIQNTLTVCRNEWKYVADISLDLDPRLPLAPCLIGDINQVILNLVVNAAHAIADVAGNGEHGKGTIGIRTRHDGNWAEISISDTGAGISEKNRSKIFTPFFTTKGVGKGTGQGLTISHSAIVGKHGGTLEFETEVGKGTTFIIRLPLLTPAVNSDSETEAIQ